MKLSIQQQNAIDLLIVGKNDRQVAEEIGVDRSTINIWRNKNAEFMAQLSRQRYELWRAQADRLRCLIRLSVDAIENALQSVNENVQVSTALAILKIIGVDQKGLIPRNEYGNFLSDSHLLELFGSQSANPSTRSSQDNRADDKPKL